MNKLVICIVTLVVFSSCKQWKNLTVKDNSAYKPAVRRNTDKVKFLENISVTPGQVVTSNHATQGSENKKGAKSMMYTQTVPNMPSSPERNSYLQLKYAGLLQALPEKLNNVDLLSIIDEWWGTRYCIGGSSKECLDCSAFTQMISKAIYQASLPRTASEQFNYCTKVSTEELQEGNLVFFHTQGKAISHVGVYLVNNKFVHVSTSQGVMINDLNDIYWKDKYKGAGRFN